MTKPLWGWAANKALLPSPVHRVSNSDQKFFAWLLEGEKVILNKDVKGCSQFEITGKSGNPPPRLWTKRTSSECFLQTWEKYLHLWYWCCSLTYTEGATSQLRTSFDGNSFTVVKFCTVAMSDLVNLVVPPSLNADEIVCQVSSSPKWAACVICSFDRLCDPLRQTILQK